MEDRLHALVIRGELDLKTAQHEIATDWIAAYKKYFHTQTPLLPRPRARNQEWTPGEQDLLVGDRHRFFHAFSQSSISTVCGIKNFCEPS